MDYIDLNILSKVALLLASMAALWYAFMRFGMKQGRPKAGLPVPSKLRDWAWRRFKRPWHVRREQRRLRRQYNLIIIGESHIAEVYKVAEVGNVAEFKLFLLRNCKGRFIVREHGHSLHLLFLNDADACFMRLKFSEINGIEARRLTKEEANAQIG